MKRPRSGRRAKGYTLIEALLTIVMSAIVLLAVSGLVGSLFKGYRASRQLQIDLENARVALTAMTKTLRGSSVAAPDARTIYAYDDSAKRCSVFAYDVGNKRIRSGSAQGDTMADCPFGTMALQDLTSSTIKSADFLVTSSKPIKTSNPPRNGVVGRVTIRFTVETDASHTADLQTTVSLRDYANIGFKK